LHFFCVFAMGSEISAKAETEQSSAPVLFSKKKIKRKKKKKAKISEPECSVLTKAEISDPIAKKEECENINSI
jgi:hypothetical protein